MLGITNMLLKDNTLMVYLMVKLLLKWVMEIFMMDNGLIIEDKDMASFTMSKTIIFNKDNIKMGP